MSFLVEGPMSRKLQCPVCKSSCYLTSFVLASHGWLTYTDHFNEGSGRWRIDREIATESTHGLYCICMQCQVFGTEAFFDPGRKPPKIYCDRGGFYVKFQLPPNMVRGLFDRVEFKCHIREDDFAGLGFIGMLKAAAVKTAAELPEFLTSDLNTVAAYAKVRLRELRAAARRKSKRKKK